MSKQLNPYAAAFAPRDSIGGVCEKCKYVYVHSMVMVLVPPEKYGDEYSRRTMHSRECHCYFKEIYLIWEQQLESSKNAAAVVIQRAFRMRLRAS